MPNAEAVLLDTHVALWWKAGGERLSAVARHRIAEAATILVSPLSCWEIGMLVGQDRVGLDRPTATWVRDLLAEERVEVVPLSPTAAVVAAELSSFHGDPVDRFLVATAIETRTPLLTKDRQIRTYAREHGGFRAVW